MPPPRGRRQGPSTGPKKNKKKYGPGGKAPKPAPRRAARPAPPPKLRPVFAEDKNRTPGSDFVRRAVEPAIGDGSTFRSGYVALVGRPNVGKSTLLNALLGQKLAATTHKPQTTRKNLLGVLHPPGAQILLLDTPGYHQAEGPLNRYMVAQSEQAIAEADVVGLVVEARTDSQVTPGNDRLLELLAKSGKKVVLLLNKIDLVKEKRSLAFQLEVYRERLGDSLVAAVPISARKRENLIEACVELGKALPVGQPYFAEDQLTDSSERSIAAEFIREKVMLATRAEVPYAVAVTIDAFEDQRPKIVNLMATLHVDRESQKPILIGKGGETLKRIGFSARRDIEFFLGSKVFLELHVRVTSGWSSDRRALAELGYSYEDRAVVAREEEE